MSAENVKAVQDLYEALGRGDVPTVLGKLDKDVEWNEAENFIYADGNPYIGPDAILKGVLLRLANEWDKFAVSPAQFLDAGDAVVVLGTYSGTYRINGTPVRAQLAHVWNFENGLVVKFQQYTDTKQFADAIVDIDD